MKFLDLNTVIFERRPQAAAPVECATCPFRTGNDKAFARVFARAIHPDHPLAWLNFMLRPINWTLATLAPRWTAKIGRKYAVTLAQRGPFVCHSTVYEFGSKVTLKPEDEHRLCKGAETCR